MATSLATKLRASAQEPAAFAEFYARMADALLRSFTRRVLSVDTALELTAETMAQAYIRRDQFRGTLDAEARAWLYAIGDHQLASYLRRKRVELKAMKRLGLERPAPVSDAEALRIEHDSLREVREAIRASLAELSAEQRQVVERRYLQGRPYSEIARELDISEEAVRARLSRALKQIRRSLAAHPTLKEELP